MGLPGNPGGSGVTWVDSTGAVIRGIDMPVMFTIPSAFASYFDADGLVWNFDPYTCAIAAWPYVATTVYASTDCTGPGYLSSGSSIPPAPRFPIPDVDGVVRVANDDRNTELLIVCSARDVAGACQTFGGSMNPCFAADVVPVGEMRAVARPTSPVCTPPLHPEMR